MGSAQDLFPRWRLVFRNLLCVCVHIYTYIFLINFFRQLLDLQKNGEDDTENSHTLHPVSPVIKTHTVH